MGDKHNDQNVNDRDACDLLEPRRRCRYRKYVCLVVVCSYTLSKQALACVEVLNTRPTFPSAKQRALVLLYTKPSSRCPFGHVAVTYECFGVRKYMESNLEGFLRINYAATSTSLAPPILLAQPAFNVFIGVLDADQHQRLTTFISSTFGSCGIKKHLTLKNKLVKNCVYFV